MNKTRIMKTISFLTALLIMLITGQHRTMAGIAYSDSTLINTETDTIDWLTDTPETDSSGANRVVKTVNAKGDTTYITLGKKKIAIIEDSTETSVKIPKNDEDEDDSEDFKWHEEQHPWKNFKGHWAGFEFGLNNYVNSSQSLERDPQNEFLDLNTGKSWNFNLNFTQYSLGFGTDKVGVVTGMGFEWCNYYLSNGNSIQKLNGVLAPKAIPDNTTKNRFQTTYLTVPLILEAQFGKHSRDNRPYIACGVIGGLKLFSNTKVKYVEDGTKKKDKNKDDFYLSPLRYAVTARAGYKAVKLYFNYYLTPLFLKDRAPELYPVATGLVVSF